MLISGVSNSCKVQSGSQAAASGSGGYLQQLSTAIQAGNIASAQQIVATLQSALQAVGNRGSAVTGSNTGSKATFAGPAGSAISSLQQRLAQISGDLQSGNLSSASTAVGSLQQQIHQAVAGLSGGQGGGALSGHHHRGGGLFQSILQAQQQSTTSAAPAVVASTNAGGSAASAQDSSQTLESLVQTLLGDLQGSSGNDAAATSTQGSGVGSLLSSAISAGSTLASVIR